MIYTWVLSRLLDWRTYAVIALLACLGTIAYKIHKHGDNGGYARGIATNAKQIEQLKHQIEIDRDLYTQSILDSSKIQTEWQAKVDNATQDANNAKAKLEILRSDNQRLNDSLHAITAKANQRVSMPTTSKDDIAEYTTTLSDVFEQCSSEYLKLAEVSESDAIGFKQVIDSYPQSK